MSKARGEIQKAFRNGESNNSASELELVLSTMGPGDRQGAVGLCGGVRNKAHLHSRHRMGLWSNTEGGKGVSRSSWSGPTFPAVSHVPAPPLCLCSQASSQERVGAQPAWQQLWAASCIQLTWPQPSCCGCHCAVTAAVTALRGQQAKYLVTPLRIRAATQLRTSRQWDAAPIHLVLRAVRYLYSSLPRPLK